MSTQLLISVCGLLFSNLLIPVINAVLYKKDEVLRKYVRLCTLFYISGTLLVLIITLLKPEVPLLWVWLCQIFVFGIYAVSCGMVVYVVKKFAEGANPSANQKPDDITPDMDDDTTGKTEDGDQNSGKQ